MPKLIDLTGQQFERLVVIKRVGKNKRGQSTWLCKCDCDPSKKIIVRGDNLKNGHTQSCGCLQQEGNNTKHGHNRRGKVTGFYQSWQNMIQRCTNPNVKNYNNYGGRGIKVCSRWLKFKNFNKDMVKGWKPGLTIERKDNNGNYCLENCKWITKAEQQKNTRRNYLITCFGKIQCIAAWSEETGILARVIRWRINHNWPPKRTLTEPVRKCKKKVRLLTEEKKDESLHSSTKTRTWIF